jgi:purine-cytosine permease-like protein
MSQSQTTQTLEVQHIDIIARSARHGRARDLFPLWFSANLNVGNAFFGALAIIVGNNFFWAVVAVVLGNIAGAAFMSLHSIQGAKLGVPQLIQSRGQFGFVGALLPVALAAFLYLGFFATTAVIGGQFLTAALPGIGIAWSAVIVSLVSLVLALVGYKAIHLAAKWAQWPLAIAVVIVTIGSLVLGGFNLDTSGFALGPFLTAFGIIATFLLTYAPYVSDYSRYLPYETNPKAAFGWTFAGAFLGTTWTELLGVMLAVQFVAGDTSGAINEMFGGGWIVGILLIVTAIAVGGNNAMNLYGSMLNLITAISTFKVPKPSVKLRFAMIMPTFLVGLWIAVSATADFNAAVGVFLSFLLLGFVPWGAINLIDYYWVRKGNYNVEAFFEPKGIYFTDAKSWTIAGFNFKALIAYAVGVATALPFVNNAVLKGAGTALVEDADISWIPGLIVTGLVYLLLTMPARAKD